MLRVGEVKLSVVSARLRLATLDLGIPSTRFRLVCLFCLSYPSFMPLCILIRPLCIGIRGAPIRLFGPMTGKLGHVLGVSDAAISPRFGHNTLNIQDLRTKSSISIHSLLLLHHHLPPMHGASRLVYISKAGPMHQGVCTHPTFRRRGWEVLREYFKPPAGAPILCVYSVIFVQLHSTRMVLQLPAFFIYI